MHVLILNKCFAARCQNKVKGKIRELTGFQVNVYKPAFPNLAYIYLKSS